MRSSAFLALTLTDSKDSQTFRTDTDRSRRPSQANFRRSAYQTAAVAAPSPDQVFAQPAPQRPRVWKAPALR